ncbi:MAG: hypothetical protein Ct9H300mP14_11250 [Gammaproteobacteria bacterium]|nr:MAG: hypothetical protein Ct9H300mP14_11250 [Gammaproteobacteria bacterium]
MWLAIGRTALEYWYLVASGIGVVAWWSQRDTRRFEDHVDLGMSCLRPSWKIFHLCFTQTCIRTGLSPGKKIPAGTWGCLPGSEHGCYA